MTVGIPFLALTALMANVMYRSLQRETARVEAPEYVQGQSGTQFDPCVVDEFTRQYHAGALVVQGITLNGHGPVLALTPEVFGVLEVLQSWRRTCQAYVPHPPAVRYDARVPFRYRWYRFRREVRRRLLSIRTPASLFLFGVVFAGLAWQLRWNTAADVAAFSSLFIGMYTLDSLFAPSPGEDERGVRWDIDNLPIFDQGGPVGGGFR
jgi:hypothetical protein